MPTPIKNVSEAPFVKVRLMLDPSAGLKALKLKLKAPTLLNETPYYGKKTGDNLG
jgi:hypothetical protein